MDAETQQYITDNLPKTRLQYIMQTQGMSSNSDSPALFTGNHGERLMEEIRGIHLITLLMITVL